MTDHNHYVPVLKGKEGEYSALQELPPTLKDRITPLVELPPIPWDYETEAPAKSIDAHIQKVASRISTAWGTNRRIFLDLLLIDADERTADGNHPLIVIFNDARLKEVSLAPVTGLSRDESYQIAVRNVARQDAAGTCLRLENADFESADLEKDITAWLRTYSHEPASTDVLIDLKEVAASSAVPLVLAVSSMIDNLPYLLNWRSLTLTASSFPENLSQFESLSISGIFRAEWAMWQSLTTRRKKLRRIPRFGDYSIGHPLVSEIDPRLMRMSANLRYTTDTDWLILKGRNVRKFGYDQFNQLCRDLVKRPEYKGESFSWGDSYINRCALNEDGPGNATTWRKVGTNHHISLVTQQIATFLGI